MQYTPISRETAQELSRPRPLPKGEYQFKCVKAEETISKSGNDQFAIEIIIYKNDGGTLMIRDWLLPTGEMKWKLRHFCDSVGLSKEYESGTLTAEMLCNSKIGWVRTDWQRPDKDGNIYTNIKDYLIKNESSSNNVFDMDFKDDEIPDDLTL